MITAFNAFYRSDTADGLGLMHYATSRQHATTELHRLIGLVTGDGIATYDKGYAKDPTFRDDIWKQFQFAGRQPKGSLGPEVAVMMMSNIAWLEHIGGLVPDELNGTQFIEMPDDTSDETLRRIAETMKGVVAHSRQIMDEAHYGGRVVSLAAWMKRRH
jgi:hypothetical protein